MVKHGTLSIFTANKTIYFRVFYAHSSFIINGLHLFNLYLEYKSTLMILLRGFECNWVYAEISMISGADQ